MPNADDPITIRVSPKAIDVIRVLLLLLAEVSSLDISNGPPATVHRYSVLTGDDATGAGAVTCIGDVGAGVPTAGASVVDKSRNGANVVSICAWIVGASVVTGILMGENM